MYLANRVRRISLWVLIALGLLHFPAPEAPAQPPAEDISQLATQFVARHRPPSIKGPLTPEVARQIRDRAREASASTHAELREQLLAEVVEMTMAGVKVLRITPKSWSSRSGKKAALYLHGGAYVFHTAFDNTVAYMADLLGIRVFSVEYRLAPEHPFPDGLEDCLAVYKSLIENHGPDNVVVLGGSAGGGMAISMLLKAREAGLPKPVALGLFTPWADLTRTGDSYRFNEGRDPVLKWEDQLDYCVRAYAGTRDLRDPLLSPVYADYTGGFPQTMIISGTRDLFLSNCVRLHRAMQSAGVEARLEIWDGMWHGFSVLSDLPEGRQARETMAGFLREALGL